MRSVDWYYHRTNCATCTKSQDFLTGHGIDVKTQRDARKQTIPAAEAGTVLKGVKEVYSTKGKKVRHEKVPTSGLSEEAFQDLLIGPSGNLRAPSAKIGSTLIVGFDEATYASVLKSE